MQLGQEESVYSSLGNRAISVPMNDTVARLVQ